ncbi:MULTISPECIES: hypothetical protein [Tenacibaculum]|uniref:hypothetical protein n=1 Tax=Tenacibaculum TaxID=104267 RepID=UPI001F0A2944|nr:MULTISPECIES: hypothetical protein [Tenacibaculum]MCH3881657.1 hypothetical protein [Tenacibaculum aquimarinum]MDO6598758.1 hypothetical protein [Tenacibaculum sp. 1_MG-2023]
MKIDVSSFGLLSQIIVFIVCLFFYIRHKTIYLLLLTLLLLSTVIVEGVGAYLIYRNVSTSFMYHYVYTLIELLIISLLFKKVLKRKNIFIFLGVIFIIFWVVVFFKNNLYAYLVILESTIISLYSFLYLREILMTNKILNYKKLLPFWVSAGFLIFYLPSIPFFSFLSLMSDRGLFPILNVLIILMNIILIYGLIWSEKEVKY